MTLNKRQREQLRMKFGGKCAYCGCELGDKWHADHVRSVMRKSKLIKGKDGISRYVSIGESRNPENDTFENLVPACRPCNIDKGGVDLEGWRGYLSERISEGLMRNSATFRHGVRFGRIVIVKEPLVFWFEKFDAMAAANGYQPEPREENA